MMTMRRIRLSAVFATTIGLLLVQTGGATGTDRAPVHGRGLTVPSTTTITTCTLRDLEMTKWTLRVPDSTSWLPVDYCLLSNGKVKTADCGPANPDSGSWRTEWKKRGEEVVRILVVDDDVKNVYLEVDIDGTSQILRVHTAGADEDELKSARFENCVDLLEGGGCKRTVPCEDCSSMDLVGTYWVWRTHKTPVDVKLAEGGVLLQYGYPFGWWRTEMRQDRIGTRRVLILDITALNHTVLIDIDGLRVVETASSSDINVPAEVYVGTRFYFEDCDNKNDELESCRTVPCQD